MPCSREMAYISTRFLLKFSLKYIKILHKGTASAFAAQLSFSVYYKKTT
jgi:hypothetical protein